MTYTDLLLGLGDEDGILRYVWYDEHGVLLILDGQLDVGPGYDLVGGVVSCFLEGFASGTVHVRLVIVDLALWEAPSCRGLPSLNKDALESNHAYR